MKSLSFLEFMRPKKYPGNFISPFEERLDNGEDFINTKENNSGIERLQIRTKQKKAFLKPLKTYKAKLPLPRSQFQQIFRAGKFIMMLLFRTTFICCINLRLIKYLYVHFLFHINQTLISSQIL